MAFILGPVIPSETNTVVSPLQKYLRLQQLAIPSKLTVRLVSLLFVTPVVIFWLWLVIVPARVAELCPVECKCDAAGYEVLCKGRPITNFSFIRLTEVRVLEIRVNNITTIESDSFVLLTELKLLRVWFGPLSTIELGAFNGLTGLNELSIRKNNIHEIKPGTFVILRNLESLDISFNKLQRLDGDVFSGLVNLNFVDLRTNKLQSIDPDTFLGLPNIEYIDFSNNPELHIPRASDFINSPSLTYLGLSQCNISSVTIETFANIGALEWLDLRHNNLTNLDINILTALPKLSKIFLCGNTINCDNQLKEFWRRCEDRNISTWFKYHVPACYTPRNMKGKWWWLLKKKECFRGDISVHEKNKPISYIYANIDDKVTNIKENGNYLKFLKNYQLPIYAVPFIFGTTSNVILLIIIICNKDMRTVPNMYIINLAISDIIYLTVLFYEGCRVATSIEAICQYGEFICRFIPFCRRLSVGLSAYSVAVLSIQRCRVIVNPFSSLPTWRVSVATVCGVWIVAALLAVPSTLSLSLCEHVVTASLVYYKRVVIFELLVSCVLPLCVIASTYIMTARHLVESSRPISEGTQNPQLQTRRNTAKIVVGLTVVFVISYLPYHLLWIYITYSQEPTQKISLFAIYRLYDNNLNDLNGKLNYTYLISKCFLFINSCLNPLALFCTSSPIRKHLKRYLTCFCKTNSPSTDIELERRK